MSHLETVFMFSGQGSQYFHMGEPLYEANPVFRKWMQRLDSLARELAGCSVIDAVYSSQRGKGDVLDNIILTHPAIFMTEYSLAQSLIHEGVRPDMVLGASLGSFAAAAVAGFLEVEDALRAVMEQAFAFCDRCEPGGMIAVIADPGLFLEGFLTDCSELAAVNFSSHFVVSARKGELGRIEAALTKRGVSYQRLPVAFAFHSQWIDKAKAPFESFMRSIQHRRGQLPLACCDQSSILTDIAGDYFWDVVRRPIRFRETAAGLEQQRARRYVDVGPAGTLATFLKNSLPSRTRSLIHAIMTPFGTDQKNLAAVLASMRN